MMKKLVLIGFFIAFCLGVKAQVKDYEIEAVESLNADNVFIWQGDTIRKDSIVYVELKPDSLRMKFIGGEFSKWYYSGSFQKVLFEPKNANIQQHIASRSNPHVVTKAQIGLGNVTDDVQVKRSEMGSNNGVATLDNGGKVPFSQLPSSLMIYKGVWSPLTNTPILADGVGTTGWVYKASMDGTVNFGSGNLTFYADDYAIYNGTKWERSRGSDNVHSVNGQQGIVTLTTTNIAEGTNKYYTDARVSANADVIHSNRTALNAVSGTNTGDQDLSISGNILTLSADASTVTLSKNSVGLGNVDNTADLSKPVSTAQQTALNLKANLASPIFTGTITTNDIDLNTNSKLNWLTGTIELGSEDGAWWQKIHTVDSADKSIHRFLFSEVQGSGNYIELFGVDGYGDIYSNNRKVYHTGNLTKSTLGLGNVDNTADLSKPVSTAQQTAFNLKADLSSPAFTGAPTAPTAATATNSTQIATTAFVKNQGYTSNTGTVTSVALTTPTGLSISGSPITSSGTLALSMTSGYSIPTTAKQTNWDAAYGWGDHSGKYAPMTTISATIPATVGWYRIATSPVDIAKCSGRFEIDWSANGSHGQVTINAGIMYGSDPTLNQIQYVHYGGGGLSKIRIVYHSTYSANYAYLEVYNPIALSLTTKVELFSSLGWSLVSPSTVGSVPTGYSTQELTFVDGLTTEGILAGASVKVGQTTLTQGGAVSLVLPASSGTLARTADIPAADGNTTYTFASGTTQGAFSVTPSGGSTQSVSVYGLGSNAYTSTAFAPLASPSLTGNVSVTKAMADYALPFNNVHLALESTNTLDNSGFVGISYASSSAANYGWTVGALRSTGGTSDFVWKNHNGTNGSEAGVERFRITSDGIAKINGSNIVYHTGNFNPANYQPKEATYFDQQVSYIGVRSANRTASQYYEFWDSGVGWADIKAGNIYANNGSSLVWHTGNFDPASKAPASGSGNYIQVSPASAQSASINITGTITSGGSHFINHSSNPYIKLSKTGATAHDWYIQAYLDGVGIGTTWAKSLTVDVDGNTNTSGNISVADGSKIKLKGATDPTHLLYNTSTDYDAINVSTGFAVENYNYGTPITVFKVDADGTTTSSGGYVTNKAGNGAELLKFNTERAWNFTQYGTGAASELRLNDLTGSKIFKITDAVSGGSVSIFNGNITATGNFNAYNFVLTASDSRLKRNIKHIDFGNIDKVKWVNFEMINDTSHHQRAGVIAQDLEKILPQFVHTSNDSMHTKSVNYTELLITAVAKLQEDVKETKLLLRLANERIGQLENQANRKRRRR